MLRVTKNRKPIGEVGTMKGSCDLTNCANWLKNIEKNAKVDKGIFAELEPDDRKQPSRRKRRKKVGAPVKAFVDSDGDDSDSAHGDSDKEEWAC